jgi:sterol desaturase/sphingolipid hydroxylase (fatty acid hydroxylase superfamily)
MSSAEIAAVRLPIAIGVLLLLLAWEVAQPFFAAFTRGPDAWKRRGLNAAMNLGLGAGNALIISGIFVGLWTTTMSWAGEHQFGLLNWLPLDSLGRILVGLLLLDVWTYTWHRLNHVMPVLWRFHRLHHADREMNVTTANRFHLVEILLSSTLRLPLLALLGLRIEEVALYDLLLFAVVQFQHANIALPDPVDRVVRWFIVTPHLHKVHHSVVRAEADSNFSSLLSCWDRVFRTLRLSRDPRRIQFGVDDGR